MHQKGSNITAERLRFDFTFGRNVTKEELEEVEKLVNEAIAVKVPVTMEEMTVAEAKAQKAMGLFESKYGEVVRVYTMGEYSKEICGGPMPKIPAIWFPSKSRRNRPLLPAFAASRPLSAVKRTNPT